MASDKRANLADMISEMIFQSQPLSKPKAKSSSKLPEKLKQARKIKSNGTWASVRDTFYKQALFLADYTDDFEYHGKPQIYNPSYEALKNDELRGYFSWRTRVRQGDYHNVNMVFIFIYAYELINNIGVKDPLDGYHKLMELCSAYNFSEHIADKLRGWLVDYIIYYNLDKNLSPYKLEETDQFVISLLNIDTISKNDLISAIHEIPIKWLGRSRMYTSHKNDMDTVIYNVLQKMAKRYAKTAKKPLVNQLLGSVDYDFINMFPTAIFCDPLKRDNYKYELNPGRYMECSGGIWSTSWIEVTSSGIRKLNVLLKAIDGLMREKYKLGSAAKIELKTKWIVNLINDEIDTVLAAKTRNESVKPIDFSQLDKIRTDAAHTRDKLAAAEQELEPAPAVAMPPVKFQPEDGQSETHPYGLSPAELRLLRSLLYSGDLAWIQQEGHILSVLVDGANEKLYDEFGDTVIADGPEIIEDYKKDLQEMIKP